MVQMHVPEAGGLRMIARVPCRLHGQRIPFRIRGGRFRQAQSPVETVLEDRVGHAVMVLHMDVEPAP